MEILVTGFEPFDGFSVNPSEEIVKVLDGNRVGKFDIVGKVLPLDYNTAFDEMTNALEKHNPLFILCCGQAPRASITIERIAVNAQSLKRADNFGNIPESDLINPNDDVAYFSTIDPHNLVKRLREENIPAAVSYHAGTYGCNWLLFKVLSWIQKHKVDAKAAFIHLPPIPSQAIEKEKWDLATMPLDLQLEAMKIIITSL